MKWGVRNKTVEKMLKMAIFKLFVLSYMHTTLYVSFFYSKKSSSTSRLKFMYGFGPK